jgi:hypothetical protein
MRKSSGTVTTGSVDYGTFLSASFKNGLDGSWEESAMNIEHDFHFFGFLEKKKNVPSGE